ncbi:Glucan endo-1,3-beta-D-glucosidase [Linum grandiflorum]
MVSFRYVAEELEISNAQAQGKYRWCIPKVGTPSAKLEENIRYVCNETKTDCGPINPGGMCYDNNDVPLRAAFIMNSYYQDHGNKWDCDFSNTATLTDIDPSIGKCQFITKLKPTRMVSWCVPKSGVSEADLKSNLDYACSQPNIDCAPIRPGGSCFEPNNVKSHAAFAMNLYYQNHGQKWDCDFSNTATITNDDPSYGNCEYISRTSAPAPAPQ